MEGQCSITETANSKFSLKEEKRADHKMINNWKSFNFVTSKSQLKLFKKEEIKKVLIFSNKVRNKLGEK